MQKKTYILLFILLFLFSFTYSNQGYCELDDFRESKSGQNLVDLENAHNQGDIRDLERRIDDLGRENRSQDERIRSLERTVSDLRRGR